MTNKRGAHVCACGDHVFTALTKGFVTFVSPQDAALVERHTWCVTNGSRNGKARTTHYAARGTGTGTGLILLHRALLDAELVDHKNGNKLDNRRHNLRAATYSQNNGNSRRHKDGAHGFKGVAFNRARQTFHAQVQVGKRRKYLGLFPDARTAAIAYDHAAYAAFGPFAMTNRRLGLL